MTSDEHPFLPGVPSPCETNSPGNVVSAFNFTLHPKSPSFTEPSAVRNTLAPVERIKISKEFVTHHENCKAKQAT